MDRTAAETHIETLEWVDKKNEERAARGARPISLPQETDTPETSEGSPDPTAENLQILVQRAETEHWDNFGFWAFRVHFSDPDLWEGFEAGFFHLLNEGIAAAPAESGMSRLDDNVMVRFVSDEDIANQGPEGVSYAYQLCIDEEQGPEDDEDADAEGWPEAPEPGMVTSMCLMVDEECMRSVVGRTPGSTPFVKAVDASLHRSEGKKLPYSGCFKVAVRSLITKFYAALLLYDPADIAATVPDSGVWTDIGPFDRDRESTKLEKLSAARE